MNNTMTMMIIIYVTNTQVFNVASVNKGTCVSEYGCMRVCACVNLLAIHAFLGTTFTILSFVTCVYMLSRLSCDCKMCKVTLACE